MPKPVRLGEPEFVSATRACQLIGCAHDTLYRMAALGLVQMCLDHYSGRPVYKLSDVRARAPGKPGRPSKDSLFAKAKAKAKARKPKGSKT